MRNNRALQRIPFRPTSDLTSRSFMHKCSNAENDLSVLHDRWQNDVARDCVISLKHLKVCHVDVIHTASIDDTCYNNVI